MSGERAASGFATGFFGCFGVLCAVGLIAVLGLVWLAMTASAEHRADQAALHRAEAPRRAP